MLRRLKAFGFVTGLALVVSAGFASASTSTGTTDPVSEPAVATADPAPRAPGPDGILPCAKRRVVLTAAYRQRNTVRFEGVTRFSLRGEEVKIRTRGRTIASAKVLPDGTFWAHAVDPESSFGGRTRFQAVAGGHRSWTRRLGQSVTIQERSPLGSEPNGKYPQITVSVRAGGVPDLVLTRQYGCRKRDARALRVTSTLPDGEAVVPLTRPAKGEPYAIYRLVAQGGSLVSSPLVVRPAR